MANLRAELKVLKPFRPKVVPMAWPVSGECLSVLEKVLADVRSGAVTEIAVAAVHRDGAVTTGVHAQSQVFTLLGGVHRLASRIEDQLRVV